MNFSFRTMNFLLLLLEAGLNSHEECHLPLKLFSHLLPILKVIYCSQFPIWSRSLPRCHFTSFCLSNFLTQKPLLKYLQFSPLFASQFHSSSMSTIKESSFSLYDQLTKACLNSRFLIWAFFLVSCNLPVIS